MEMGKTAGGAPMISRTANSLNAPVQTVDKPRAYTASIAKEQAMVVS
jgi:hypothetical protein